MKVKIKIRDKDLQVVDIKDYEFDDFCYLLSRKINSLLYLIEDYTTSKDENKSSFKDIRNNILDVSGEIRRLPNTILFNKEKEEL